MYSKQAHYEKCVMREFLLRLYNRMVQKGVSSQWPEWAKDTIKVFSSFSR